MSPTFDLICVGSGPASTTVATMCTKKGLHVALIESGDFGGTCALRGCNPKKVFTNAAALIDQFRRATGRPMRGNDQRIEWSVLVSFQHEFTGPAPALTKDKFRRLGIELIRGRRSLSTTESSASMISSLRRKRSLSVPVLVHVP